MAQLPAMFAKIAKNAVTHAKPAQAARKPATFESAKTNIVQAIQKSIDIINDHSEDELIAGKINWPAGDNGEPKPFLTMFKKTGLGWEVGCRYGNAYVEHFFNTGITTVDGLSKEEMVAYLEMMTNYVQSGKADKPLKVAFDSMQERVAKARASRGGKK